MRKLKLLMACLLAVVTTSLSAQSVRVSGTVTDASTGEGIPSASILVRGTLTGTSTDLNGNYSIQVPAGSVLEFSSIGYVSVSEGVNGRTIINVALEPDSEFLDDVIVVAYGTASRAAFTGSAVQVKGDDIAKVSHESLDKGLIGRVSGVRIQSDNGDPGSAASIQIRGVGSISGTTQPLYVIDGVIIDPATSGDTSVGYKSTAILNSINPDDIESMTVLKDAAAASLYGSRAANGVILITTKKGTSGKTTVTYTGEAGISQIANMKAFDIMDGPTFMQWVADSYDGYYQANGYPAGTITVDDLKENGWFYDPSGKTSTKWQNEVFQTAPTTNHQIGVSGGNERTQFYAGLGFSQNKGVVLGSSFARYSGRVNVDHKINDWLKASFRQMLSFNKTNGYNDQSDQEQGWGTSTPTSSIFQQDPTAPAKDADGNWLNHTSWSGSVDNPHLAFEDDSYEYYNTNTTRSLSNMDVTLTFAPWLYLTNTFGYDWSDSRQYMWWGPTSVDGGSYTGLKSEYDLQSKTLSNSAVLHFDQKFGEHAVTAIAGYEYSDHYSDYIYASTSNFPTPKLTALSVGQLNGAGGSRNRSVMNSILGSVNYNYADTYYLSASFRRDGSSRLGPNNRWANFWSVSGAWRLTGEDFMSGIPLFTDFKVKASYGTNGNLPGGYYSYKQNYAIGSAYAAAPAIYGSSAGNPDLGWEKSKNFNVGFEWNMYNRVNLSVEYYNKYTSALLFPRPTSIVTGFSSYTANIGNLSNYGIEVELNTRNIVTTDFSWTTDFNFTWQKNVIVELPDHEDVSSGDGGLYLLREGESMYSFYLPVMKGVNKETGLAEFWLDPEDESKGVTNYYSQAGSTIVGKGTPDFIGGMTNTLRYKNIDLSFLISYQFGAALFDYMEYFTVSDGMRMGNFNQLAKAADYWTPTNTDAKYPKVIYGNPYRSDRWSTRHIKSTDNIRLREITLGYTLPIKKVVDSVRLYFKATNPFMIWSATPDVDPDVPINGYRTVDVPVTRSFVGGINITF
ncbi:MAG: TonB-dependent receptor [Bacteroidales bacterium]|nr:TonB-dependent receptor [Bacteroidales bacterium]